MEQSKIEVAQYNQLRKDNGSAVISYSHLRIENKILNNKSTYPFQILPVGGEISTEVKLDKNDTFYATKMGLFVYERSTATSDEGRKVLQTYPNNSFFTAGTAFVIADLETLYNGYIDIKKGTTVIVEKLDTRNFREVSMTQQSSATTKSSQRRDSGFIDMFPVVALPGKEQVTITGSFPVYSACNWQSDATTTETRMALIIRGYLVKGGSL